MSLLEAVGTVTVHHDGKVTVTVGSERTIFDPPVGKDIDAQMVVDLRHMLSKAVTARPERSRGHPCAEENAAAPNSSYGTGRAHMSRSVRSTRSATAGGGWA